MINPISRNNLIRGDVNPLSKAEYATITERFRAGAKYREIEAATGRTMGTIKTAIRTLRNAGLVQRRNVATDWSLLDA